MTGGDDSLQSIGVRLDGKNYSYWNYVMTNFLKGKGVWEYVSGKIKCPVVGVEKFDELFRIWDTNNSKIITWINNSVEHRIGVQLAKFKTAKEIWDYLSKLFVQNNFAVKYQLQSEIRALVQNDLSIQDFFCAMTTLWDRLALTESVELQTCDAYIKCRDEDRLVQLLMGLRPEFENCRSSLLHRKPLPSVEDVINELMAEETCLKTLKGVHNISTSVLAASPSAPIIAAPAHQYKTSVTGNCNYCKKPGHWKNQCPELRKESARKLPGHGRKSPQQYQGGQQKMYFEGPSQNLYPSTPAAFMPSLNHSASASEFSVSTGTNSIVDQFQKFLAFQQFQKDPHNYALSAPSSSSSSIGSGIPSSPWILDSGAGNHMSHDPSSFTYMSPDPPSISVMTADGTQMSLKGTGSIQTPTLSLPDVYFIPKLHMNLVSVGQLCDSGCFVGLLPNSCYVQDLKSKRVIGTGHRKGKGPYVLDELHLPTHVAAMPVNLSSFHLTPSSSKFYLWHSRLGHLSGSRLRSMCTSDVLGDLPPDDISDCSGCKLGKFSALPFILSTSTSSAPFDLVHSDVWGPAPIPTKGGSRYYVSLIDDHTRYCWIYLMKRRSDLSHIYAEFKAYVKTQHSATIKCFRADLGGEYTSGDLSGIFKADGTIHQSSCTDTPQQNGVAERKHRHIIETARSMLLSASVPSEFWGEAVLTSVYLINRIPTAHNSGISPYAKLFGHTPLYSHLRVFGSTCFVLRPHAERSKLSSRVAICVFLGYGVVQKGYRCYDPASGKLYVSRNVSFIEHIPFFTIPPTSHDMSKSDLIQIDPFITDCSSENANPHETIAKPHETIPNVPLHPTCRTNDVDTHPLSTTVSEPPIITDPNLSRYPTRTRRSTQVSDFDYSCYTPSFASFLVSNNFLREPTSYSEASRDPLWQEAMNEELSALDRTGTWDLVSPPVGKKIIGSRWVYKIKTKSDGSIERYKARLVAKGYAQEYGMDYEETFAPVAKMTSVRVLIAVASVRRWSISQMDVKNAFLNGDLQEEVYMVPPPGVSHRPGQVCRLKKALYGLKQAPRAWFDKFSSVVYSLGFTSSSHDSALFVKSSPAGHIVLLLYVDDMIITGDDADGISDLKATLSRRFEMKDLGNLRYFLGIEVAYSERGYLLSQSKYTSDILERSRLTDTCVVDSPLEVNVRYNPTDGDPLADPTLYRSIVGSLVYLTITRPDIAYAVHIVSQFVCSPTSVHWAAVMRILRYLRGTLYQSLLFPSTSSLELRAFSDADWATDQTDRKSTTGYCVFLGDSLISWKSKKQDVVSRSSTEAEYRAMASTTSEIIWLRWLLTDMGVSLSGSTPMYCDNKSAIQIAHNTVFHERTKHIEIDCHFTRHHFEQGTISLPFVSSSMQLADFFTKAHTIKRHRFFLDKLSMFLTTPSRV